MLSLFKNKLTVDQAAEELYTIIGKDDKTAWIAKLKTVPGLNIIRASYELEFLDFFTIYFSLKFTPCSGWSEDKKILVLEKFFDLFAGWLGRFWESKNIGRVNAAYRTLHSRIKSYSEAIDASSEDPADLTNSIGTQYAAYAFCDETFEVENRSLRDGMFPLFQEKLLHDIDNVVIKVGGNFFNYRLQDLYPFFDTHKLA